MVRSFISCALRGEGLECILNSIDYQFSPIGEHTEKWVYVPVVREKCSRVGYAGNITGWSGIAVLGLAGCIHTVTQRERGFLDRRVSVTIPPQFLALADKVIK